MLLTRDIHRIFDTRKIFDFQLYSLKTATIAVFGATVRRKKSLKIQMTYINILNFFFFFRIYRSKDERGGFVFSTLLRTWIAVKRMCRDVNKVISTR